MVYVQDIHGNALMPTNRFGWVRRMIRDGKAVVIHRVPFTIRLTYSTSAYVQNVTLGVDAGSKIIGISATTTQKELFSAEVKLRDDIVKKIAKRQELRRNRRFRKTRYREARFDNRKGCKFAPSVEYRINKHLSLINWVKTILPISQIIIEVAQFDMQKIKNPDIQGEEYQHGEQLGFWNVREYVLCRDGHKCQNCHGKSKDPVLNVHHIESRSTGGNAPNNLITLCESCHKEYHRGTMKLKIKRGTSLRDAAAMNIMRWELFNRVQGMFCNVKLTYGYITKNTRIRNDIAKTRCSDAFCISKNIKANRLGYVTLCRCIPRHSRVLHTEVPKQKGFRRSCVAPVAIAGSRFRKHDRVLHNGEEKFISGSTGGRPCLVNIHGKRASDSASVNIKTLKFITHSRMGMLIQNTCEF